MFSYCAYDLSFLHFGTSSEVLDHLSGASSVLIGRRHQCSIPATNLSDIAASAVLLSSKIAPAVSIGEDSLIYDQPFPVEYKLVRTSGSSLSLGGSASRTHRKSHSVLWPS
ncbi:bifunctional fucokinase/fucose pyrophosphorylase [Prunus yedoensis var. nudiflora]|uniref:Bifunctional fucokinase/fucose pyrophosphorylase n=1 Tax=Prunus yedoensis var. nudiflora TaxID=2094558 RepID=A0A314ZWN5_PRUYE|nr:bifunctional fucokinase/fucose pyrophosphorylase [Prunus yedoensis var. nudiflora]